MSPLCKIQMDDFPIVVWLRGQAVGLRPERGVRRTSCWWVLVGGLVLNGVGWLMPAGHGSWLVGWWQIVWVVGAGGTCIMVGDASGTVTGVWH